MNYRLVIARSLHDLVELPWFDAGILGSSGPTTVEPLGDLDYEPIQFDCIEEYLNTVKEPCVYCHNGGSYYTLIWRHGASAWRFFSLRFQPIESFGLYEAPTLESVLEKVVPILAGSWHSLRPRLHESLKKALQGLTPP